MKRFLIIMSLIATQAFAATTYTTNYNLAKPGDGDTNWGSLLRDNFDTIDAQLDINSTSTSDHINETTGAHAASAISANAGASTCTSADDVQEFLDCLDSEFGAVVGGSVVTVSGSQTITGQKTFSSVITASGGIDINGSASFSLLSDGPAYISSNVLLSETYLDLSRGGTGIDASAVTNGQLLIGGSSGFSIANITGTSNQVTVTDGDGSITLSTPQDIHTAATPTFASVTATTSIILQDPGAGTDTITLSAPTSPANYTITLPAATPAPNTGLAYNGSDYVWASVGGWSSSVQTSLSGSGTITISLTQGQQAIEVQGNGAAVTLASAPFGSSDPNDKTVVRLVGRSNTNTVTITNSDTSNGCLMNGNAVIGLGDVIEFMYVSSMDRWIETSRNF